MCSDLLNILHMWHNQQSIVCGHHQLPSEHNMPSEHTMPPSTICRAGNRILRNCSPAAEVDGDHRLALTRRQIEVRIGLERTRHDLEISQPAIVGISGSCHGYIWCRDVSVSFLNIQHLRMPGTPTETRERDFSLTAAWKDRFENAFK